MIASTITSRKRATRPCTMTSPLCWVRTPHPEIGDMWNFTSLGLPFSKYLAVLSKSLPNKMPTKIPFAQKIPKNFHLLRTRTWLRLVRNAAVFGAILNAPYKHNAEIPLLIMDNEKSCHEQILLVSACQSQDHVATSTPRASLFSY